MTTTQEPQEDWIKVSADGTFVCAECENEVHPETNTPEGIVEADIHEVKSDLEQYPTKVIYAICPICGMEYVFRLHEGQLYVEPSAEEK